MIKLFGERFQESIFDGLPGLEAHMRMIPNKLMSNYEARPANARMSAVLILCYEQNGEIFTVLFKRTEDGSPHSGQISFPGGKAEENDKDLIETALRETEEEIGVDRKLVSIVGSLTPIYIPVSNFSVQPVVGILTQKPAFLPNEQEVQEIICVSFEHLFDAENRFIKTFNRGGYVFDAHCIDVNGHTVWGATATILAEVEELYKKTMSVLLKG